MSARKPDRTNRRRFQDNCARRRTPHIGIRHALRIQIRLRHICSIETDHDFQRMRRPGASMQSRLGVSARTAVARISTKLGDRSIQPAGFKDIGRRPGPQSDTAGARRPHPIAPATGVSIVHQRHAQHARKMASLCGVMDQPARSFSPTRIWHRRKCAGLPVPMDGAALSARKKRGSELAVTRTLQARLPRQTAGDPQPRTVYRPVRPNSSSTPAAKPMPCGAVIRTNRKMRIERRCIRRRPTALCTGPHGYYY